MKDHRFVGVPTLLAREHLRSDGRPKRRLTKAKATKVADHIGATAYHCRRCGKWHVGQGP